MAISYKTIPYILPSQMASLYNIAISLNLERLYNKTSNLGIDYEKGCQIFNDFDKCTVVSHIYRYDRAKTLSFILLIRRKSTKFENESNV